MPMNDNSCKVDEPYSSNDMECIEGNDPLYPVVTLDDIKSTSITTMEENSNEQTDIPMNMEDMNEEKKIHDVINRMDSAK